MNRLSVIDSEAVRTSLPYNELVHELKAAHIANEIVTPDRTSLPLSAAMLLLMPGWDAVYVGTKIVIAQVGPDKPARRSVSSLYVLSDRDTGDHLAVIDGDELTQRRTAATAALGASMLARPESSTLLIVGAGRIGSALPAAYSECFALDKVLVYDLVPEASERLVASLGGLGFACEQVVDLQDAVQHADIIACATLSQTPVVMGDWLKPGTHVDLLGSFRPNMREVDARCVQLATIYVDTLFALEESGDLAAPLASGVLHPPDVRGTLGDVGRKQVAGRTSREEVTLMKSVGSALADLVAAELVYKRTCQANGGPA